VTALPYDLKSGSPGSCRDCGFRCHCRRIVSSNEASDTISCAPIPIYLLLLASRNAETPSSQSPIPRLSHCDLRKSHHRSNCLDKTVFNSPSLIFGSVWSDSHGRIALSLAVGVRRICMSSSIEQAGRAPSSMSAVRLDASDSAKVMGGEESSVKQADSGGGRWGYRAGEPSWSSATVVRSL
jgi:hypothetical protein